MVYINDDYYSTTTLEYKNSSILENFQIASFQLQTI